MGLMVLLGGRVSSCLASVRGGDSSPWEGGWGDTGRLLPAAPAVSRQPYAVDGQISPQSNVDFDRSLRQR